MESEMLLRWRLLEDMYWRRLQDQQMFAGIPEKMKLIE